MRTVIRNATMLDTTAMAFIEVPAVVIEDGLIVEVGSGAGGDADVDIDASGKYVVPGLIDAHVHFRLASLDFAELMTWSEVEFGIAMAALSRNTLERGFTTVRDLGADVNGLLRAIASGAAVGPRIVRAGLMLTQTGGHGDAQAGHRAVPECACALRSDWASIVADGPDAVRKAARHLLRDGSDFLKIHVSGGVASPSDPLDNTQYTPEEVRVAVVEAANRGTYVAAHAYTPEAITMAVTEGVHTVEHGNLIDEAAAAAVAAAGSVMVPTLSTYWAMEEVGAELGMPAANLAKNKVVFEAGLESVQKAVDAGVTLGLGTDLLGETQPRQNGELLLRAEVQSSADVLHSMWVVNASLCRLEGKVGTIAPGAFGDVVITGANPLEDLSGFADHERTTTHVIQGGRIVVDRSG